MITDASSDAPSLSKRGDLERIDRPLLAVAQ